MRKWIALGATSVLVLAAVAAVVRTGGSARAGRGSRPETEQEREARGGDRFEASYPTRTPSPAA